MLWESSFLTHRLMMSLMQERHLERRVCLLELDSIYYEWWKVCIWDLTVSDYSVISMIFLYGSRLTLNLIVWGGDCSHSPSANAPVCFSTFFQINQLYLKLWTMNYIQSSFFFSFSFILRILSRCFDILFPIFSTFHASTSSTDPL